MPLERVRIEISEAELRRILTGPNGMVTDYVFRLVRQIRTRAVLYCPVDTGYLRASITYAVRDQGGMVITGTVGTPVDYALPVHEGTKPRSVTTVTRRKSRNGRVRATSTSRTVPGRAGRPFLRRALNDVVGA